MILIDLNQVMISNLMAQIGNHHNIELDENLIRHMVLNSIRNYRNKFKKDFGELVICCDDKNYWRKEVFPYYKASRKKNREKSELDWNEIFRVLNKIRDELKEFFPYKVIQIDTAEADDIIGTICHIEGKMLTSDDPDDKILILSADKDYIQLHTYANVSQFDPIRKKWIRHDNPSDYLKVHIMKGDIGDGVPNMLSADDVFVMSKRQKPLTQKRIDEFMKNGSVDPETIRGYTRNEALIDLSKIPVKIKEQVIDKYNEEKKVSRSNLMNFFMNNKLKNLLENIGEF